LRSIYVTAVALLVITTGAVQYNPNPTSEMSADDKNTMNKTTELSDESGHEIEIDEDIKEKKFLDDAMKIVLDPSTTLLAKTSNILQSFKNQLDELDNASISFDVFMDSMDKLSLYVCKTSQEALWSYVIDSNDDAKKNAMIRIAAEEDEIKKQYWNILKKNYLKNYLMANSSEYNRKIRIIKERGTNVQMPQSKQREEIDTMQKIWSRVGVCPYNNTKCDEDSLRTMNDVISIFKTSNDSKELKYYWGAYRNATGKRVRPIFKDYVKRMNVVAKSENFTDAGEMWRYAFEDDNFVNNVNRIWHEIKPFYCLLHDYVRVKLKVYYDEDLKNEKLIPAHILGNLWAQEWQSIFSKVVPYPNHMRPVLKADSIRFKDLFDAVDNFHISLGFESAKDSYKGIKETVNTANCLPSSHDMCDGVNYMIKWCGEKVTDAVVGLSRAARLLGHIQYFKHYKNLPPLYRDGPSPEHLKTLQLMKVETGTQVTLNHLLWVALEKFPLMAYAYVLDQWRIKETGVSPPLPRNEHDLDPAAKYHVVSHVQYITDGMSLGASKDWRTVLETMTGETELSTQGILDYFAPLQDFLRTETARLESVDTDLDKSAPMIVGAVACFLFVLIIVLYCVKKRDSARKMFSSCGLSNNGSLDIVTNDMPQKKSTEVERVSEDKV
ncbi:Angiotensin-converting enzyme, partial [Operophtera brumata]